MGKQGISVFIFAVVMFSFLLSAAYYPQAPEMVASHWNFEGQVDGYMHKSLGLFLFPVLIAFMAALFALIPKIDPLKKNIELFRKHYDRFIVLLLIFMLAIQLQVMLWSAGARVSPNIVLPPLLAILFYCAGDLCENSKRNWSIGVRTPWTMSSDRVWARTNRLGGKMFKLAAVLSIVGVLFGKYALFFVVVPVVLGVVYLMAYSYLEYQNENKKGRGGR